MLLSEIWKSILLNLRHKYIFSFSKTCKYYKNLCIEENIFEERKWLGFPRKEGHCQAHDITKFAGHNQYDTSLYDLLLNAKYNGYGFNKIQNLILDELYGTNTYLVRGDLIILDNDYTNTGLYIFDGFKIRELDFKFNLNGILPQNFTVINNNVSIDYWKHITKWKKNSNMCEKIIINRGIRGKYKFWFDHDYVKKQCLDNIKYELTPNIITTNFIYNNINYIIRASYDNQDIFININRFRKILDSSDKLLLHKNTYDKLNIYDYMSYLPSNATILYLSINHNEKYRIS